MPLKLRKTVKQMLAEANAEIETVSAADAIKLKDDPGVVFVDIRDIRELARDGRIPGAVHAPRGMLEFWVRSGKSLLQRGLRLGQKISLLLSWRRTICAGSADSTANGPGARVPYGRGLHRLESRRRTGRARKNCVSRRAGIQAADCA